jgi:hypothetical protein
MLQDFQEMPYSLSEYDIKRDKNTVGKLTVIT